MKKKLGPVFNFKLGPVLTLKPPNLGPAFNFTAYIYAVKLLSGPSLGVLNVIIWSKFVFYKTAIVKNTINIEVSALFFWKKIARRNFKCYYLVQVDAF